MKYILRYESRSKYMGFKKIYYEEFEKLEDVLEFLFYHQSIIKFELYERK